MNGFLQLLAAVLFLLADQGRMVRGAWRRNEWRNVAVRGCWFSLTIVVVAVGPATFVWAAFALLFR